MADRRRKIRTDFRKNRTYRTRRTDWTRQFQQDGLVDSDAPTGERVSGKGELSRRRTVVGVESESIDQPGVDVHLEVDRSCLPGRVLCVMGCLASSRPTTGGVFVAPRGGFSRP